jgi:hypothetical protein
MNKRKLIQKAEELLKEAGFIQSDYVVSLQGPTIIFAESGRDKLEKDLILKADLMHTGILIL